MHILQLHVEVLSDLTLHGGVARNRMPAGVERSQRIEHAVVRAADRARNTHGLCNDRRFTRLRYRRPATAFTVSVIGMAVAVLTGHPLY